MDKTSKNLVIVESPNKRATLMKIFTDAGYKNTNVMATYGHFSIIKDGGKYWNTGIEPDNNFKTNYQISREKLSPKSSKTYYQLVEELTLQAKAADKVYICSDPDREGEAIAWSVKKFLKIPDSKYERITFHEITPKAVLKAFNNPRKIDNYLVDSAQSRQVLDKLTGYRLSPVVRKKTGAKSVGRCQSAGLKLIVDREKEIQRFKAEDFWELYLLFEKNGTNFKAKYVGTPTEEIKKFTNLNAANDTKASCKIPYTITDIESGIKYINPKPPFTTSTFQQEVFRKLGISTKTAQSYAQKLFEGLEVNGEHIALITYIRTDSTELAPEFLPELENHIISTYGKEYYTGVRKVKKSELAQDGHEAIRPVSMAMTPEKLAEYIDDPYMLEIYEIIYRRTEACAMAPTAINETVYTIESNKNLFSFTSRELSFDGFKRAYSYKEDNEDDEVIRETFSLGEQITQENDPHIEVVKKTTKPPVRYKEDTLIKELEAKGIGRPSTYNTILDTLLSESRGYCTVEDKCIVPTELGIRLIEFLDANFPQFFSISYTSEMEADLDKIKEGKLDKLAFLTEFYNTMEDAANKIVKTPEPTEEVCPECGKPLVVRMGKWGPFYGCSGYPKCKYIGKAKPAK